VTEDISRHLLTLGSEDRLTLLTSIRQQKQRLTALAKVIGASNQECSRHLARLVESNLIRKQSDGSYEATPLGTTILDILPGIQFLMKNANYVVSHNLSSLPLSFVERIGELADGKLVGHFNIVLEQIKNTIAEAREYLWLISDQPIIPTATLGAGFPVHKLPVRLLIEPGYDLKAFSEAKSSLPAGFELRMVRGVKIAMAINEKIAGLCFPGPDGKIDFGVGFTGSDARFRGWCSDLFEHYWKSAEAVRF